MKNESCKLISIMLFLFTNIIINDCIAQIPVELEIFDSNNINVENAVVKLKKKANKAILSEQISEKGKVKCWINEKYANRTIVVQIEKNGYISYSSEIKIKKEGNNHRCKLRNIGSTFSIRLIKMQKDIDSVSNRALVDLRNTLGLKVEKYSIDNDHIYTVGRAETVESAIKLLKDIVNKNIFEPEEINVVYIFKNQFVGKFQAQEIKYKIQLEAAQTAIDPKKLYDLSSKIGHDIIWEKVEFSQKYPYRYLVDDIYSNYFKAKLVKENLSKVLDKKVSIIYYFDIESRIN